MVLGRIESNGDGARDAKSRTIVDDTTGDDDDEPNVTTTSRLVDWMDSENLSQHMRHELAAHDEWSTGHDHSPYK